MVCWLALCLGRKAEERLGKERQGKTGGIIGGRGGKEEEEEEEDGSQLVSPNHFG